MVNVRTALPTLRAVSLVESSYDLTGSVIVATVISRRTAAALKKRCVADANWWWKVDLAAGVARIMKQWYHGPG